MILELLKKFLFLLLLTMIYSCSSKINVDENFKSSGLKNEVYKRAINYTQDFLKEYNDSLKLKIHKRFWKDFDYYERNNIVTDIIISKQGEMLIGLEQSGKNEKKWNVYYSDINAQLFLTKLKTGLSATEPSFAPLKIRGSNNFISGGTWGVTVICELKKSNKASVALYDVSSKIPDGSKSNNPYKFRWPTTNFILRSTFSKEAGRIFKVTAGKILSLEVQEMYINSDAFKKSRAHPLLKKAAEKIILRKDQAANRLEEYPLWEFDEDVKALNLLGKKHNLDESYVDNILNDSQYSPTSGTLFWYYSNPKNFMRQWILVNICLLILFFIWKAIHQEENEWLNGIALGCLAVINGFVFSKKPDLIGIQYWIIPGLLFIANFFIIYSNKFLQIFKS